MQRRNVTLKDRCREVERPALITQLRTGKLVLVRSRNPERLDRCSGAWGQLGSVLSGPEDRRLERDPAHWPLGWSNCPEGPVPWQALPAHQTWANFQSPCSLVGFRPFTVTSAGDSLGPGAFALFSCLKVGEQVTGAAALPLALSFPDFASPSCLGDYDEDPMLCVRGHTHVLYTSRFLGNSYL